MDYAGRFNSFVFKGIDVLEAISHYKNIDKLNYLEFNYPEHITSYDIDKLKEIIPPLKVNGFAVRWRNSWLNGNFTNKDKNLRHEAIELTKRAIDDCRELGGKVITLWFENDGFDYPFQLNYESAWNNLITAIREVADYGSDMKISIEYKPFEEREFALIDSTGMVMYLISEVNRENVGCTLDFCHMLMKHDSPSFGLTLAALKDKLFGLHMNDGYGWKDSGLIFGSLNFSLSAEFIYYLKKYNYKGIIFFDTFPIRENADEEIKLNIESFESISKKIDAVGLERIQDVIDQNNGIKSQELIMEIINER